MQKIRIGLIGCGSMGSKHMRHLWDMAGSPDSKALPTVLVDHNPERLQSLATTFPPAITFEDHRNPNIVHHVDAVIIAVSPFDHPAIAEYFLERGKDVFVEKPMEYPHFRQSILRG